MMLTFLVLTHMVDATQHNGVGWAMMLGNDVNVP